LRTKATLWRSALVLLLIACSVVSAQARKPVQAESTNPTNVPVEKTPAVAAHHPLELVFESVARTPSMEMPHYLETGVMAKTPWHPSVAVPLPGEIETAAKTPWHPSVAIPLPGEIETVAKTPWHPSVAIPLPGEIETAAKTPWHPSVAVPLPGEIETAAKTPSHPSVAIPLPGEIETAAKIPWHPSVAVPLPLEVEARATTLSFQLAQESAVEIVIYSVNGRVVRTLADQHFSMGSHSVEWDGLDDGGSRTASGVYFARLRAGEQLGKGKLILVR